MPDLARIESLFHRALAVSPTTCRAAWLAAECGADTGLLSEVSALLEARDRMNRIAADPPPVPTALFGPWRPIRLIGHGGMSAVYLAERADGQFHQSVALKVMAGYLAGTEFVRRFGAEREFLASLNHIGITRLLDGGVSSSGDPYLVTEYVDGETIDRYCDGRRLGVAQRLRVFLQACEAVEYAHRNLIIHRDLKPANILVNREGEVKLLDFGAAALTAAGENPTLTRTRMLTPRYASPEQLRGERLGIATDTFSLGVILYELLSGAWPYGDPGSALHGMARSSPSMEAAPVTARLTAEAAASRSLSREQLRRSLKGDLSAILAKALHPHPSCRYASVRDFAGDIKNSLEGRPVAARPQPPWYETIRFLRRHWRPATAGFLFVSALTLAAWIAMHEARRAQAAASSAQTVNQFLSDILHSTGIESRNPKNVTVSEMLDVAAARLEKHRTGTLAGEGALRLNLGTSYANLMEFERAEPQLQQALRIFDRIGDREQAAHTIFQLGLIADARGDHVDAVARYDQVLDALRRMGNSAPALLDFRLKAALGGTLSLLLNRRLPEARTLLDEAIALGNRDSSIPRTELAVAIAGRAIMLQNEGKRKEAEALDRRALELGRREDPDGLWQIDPLFSLATLIAPADPHGAAELSHQRYLVLAGHLGADTAPAAVSKILWVRQRVDAGELAGAAEEVEQAMQVVRRSLLPSSMDLWFALSSAAHVMNRVQRFEEAESLARAMFPVIEANNLPANDPRRGDSWFELGIALHGLKKEREAADALDCAVRIFQSSGPAVMAKWAAAIRADIALPAVR